MAWYFGDETAMSERDLSWTTKSKTYNWGYDPQNYFSPDGAYSVNPADPTLRIKELKTLINAVHEREMGVILDVVYTHMIKADFLEAMVPDYYFF
jgi:pullulanase/glycogen debranching enzyme